MGRRDPFAPGSETQKTGDKEKAGKNMGIRRAAVAPAAL